MSEHEPNDLIHSTSPYLKQHAYNPVRWAAWSPDIFKRASQEDKIVLLSIGYSACHWCHVMEKECFEDFEVAEIMNSRFINVKIDREERPDVDQVYMSAVQLMTGRGGWPLNCFTLPDGRPVFGGTYFPKKQWMSLLLNLSDNFRKSKEQFVDYAARLTDGIVKIAEIGNTDTDLIFSDVEVEEFINKWKKELDPVHGGPDRAPKFPMPVHLQFLLHYGIGKPDSSLTDHVALTLNKMSLGGIYDQLGGGFARYSVDAIWKVPHFEKMLYDNAQLVSVYAEYCKWNKQQLFEETVHDTLTFIDRELSAPGGGYHCALDADSEGIEGKYYTWTAEELKDELGDDYELFSTAFQVNKLGYWENGQNILMREHDEVRICQQFGLTKSELDNLLRKLKSKLLLVRQNRIKPGLDNKLLTSWNALMIVGLVDAFEAFGNIAYLQQAEQTCKTVLQKAGFGKNELMHLLSKNPMVKGFLDDYAFVIYALIRLYQCNGDAEMLNKASSLTDTVFREFNDDQKTHFYYTPISGDELISRQAEVQDNVIPASNSQMAINFYFLGHYFQKQEWIQRSRIMLAQMQSHIQSYPSGYANWLQLWLIHSTPVKEVVVCGPQAIQIMYELRSSYLSPGTITAVTTTESNLPQMQGRFVAGKNLIYVCSDGACQLPVSTTSEARALIIRK